MRVFIAEKPLLANAIAAVLPGPQKRHKTHITSGESNVVVWCAGHIMEQYAPDDYDPNLKRWTLEQLPLEPEQWKVKVTARTKELYQTIERFVKDADLVVHAGDPDAEGQLIVDEVLEHIGVDVPVKRILIADLNPPAVRRALGNLEDNSAYAGLRDAALGRSRADWLYGLNLTRLYTLLGKAGGHSGVLSIGRVQTPVLGLVVRRDLAIEAFESKPFYTLKASIDVPEGQFVANWAPGENAADYQDSEGRVIDQAFAKQLGDKLWGGDGEIVSLKQRHRKEAPPLPFSLATLQKAAAKGRGLSLKQTLDIAQSLYEKHQVLTYPRSDCAYLPTEHHIEASEIRAAIAQSIGPGHTLEPVADGVDLVHRGRCWNDKEVTVHYAIIPTKKWVPLERLTDDERWVYELVAHRYLLQFYTDREYDQTDVVVQLAAEGESEQFKAKGRVETHSGWVRWKNVLSPASTRPNEQNEDDAVQLPVLVEGEGAVCTECLLVEKATTAPKRYDDESLLDAMIGIHRYVQDPDVKKLLKETEGLGTPATQANIIETLFKRGYLERKKKRILSTVLGRELVDILPESVTLPDMTAQWEQRLGELKDGVTQGGMSLEGFMAQVGIYTKELVVNGIESGALVLKGAVAPKKAKVEDPVPCPKAGCGGRFRRIKTKKGYFWGCINYAKGCRETRQDVRGKPGKG